LHGGPVGVAVPVPAQGIPYDQEDTLRGAGAGRWHVGLARGLPSTRTGTGWLVAQPAAARASAAMIASFFMS
jgi:hypothetical protein